MTLERNKLYSILFTACLAGYIWLYFSISATSGDHRSIEVCLIKHVINIPCPSCGATRSVISLAKGNLTEALSANPIGLIVAIIMLITPLWIVTDTITESNSLFDFYKRAETYLKRPGYAVPLILLVIINWIWAISKGL